MKNKTDHEPCPAAACGSIAVERNRYFNGKYMTARDFAGEQEYFLSRHRLHNRLFHGWGVVCGLRVIPHPKDDCKERWVVVRAGIALDCRGREIVLCRDTPFELPLPADGDAGDDAPASFLLCLRYGEEEVETVPVLHADGPCDPSDREANRVRETAVLAACPLDEVEPDCWRTPQGDPEAACRDDCDDQLPGPAPGCIEPVCPCGDCVPLALIRPADEETGWESGYEIDTSGRRTLPVPSDYLTHVVGINWTHGGTHTLSELAEDRDGELKVYFDRRLLAAEGEATGVNEHTFTVQYGGVQQDLEFLPHAVDSSSSDQEGAPGLTNDGCVAVFKIDPTYLTGPRNIAGNVVYVTLKCDFIRDCHEIPVDGDHLGGRLPSGDGTPGGTFESWFRVEPDAAPAQRKGKKK